MRRCKHTGSLAAISFNPVPFLSSFLRFEKLSSEQRTNLDLDVLITIGCPPSRWRINTTLILKLIIYIL